VAKIFVRDLQPGQTYGIQLRADDGDAQSEWSPIHYFTTTIATVGPNNVTGLTWVTNGTSFLATWNAVTHNTDGSEIKGPVVYEVIITDGETSLTYRPTQPRFDFSYEMNRDGFGTPKPGLTIFVRAVNTSGVKSITAASAFALNDPPDPPTDFSATEFTNQVVIEWEPSPSEDVVAYVVHAGEGAGFVPSEGNIIWSGAGFSAIHHSTEYSTDFYYKVMAIDVFGTASDPLEGGPFSPLGISGTIDDTAPANPTGVTATTAPNADPSGQYTDLTVSWTGPTEASDTSLSVFNVRYGYDGTTWNYIKVPSDQLTAKIPRLLAGGSIYVQVQAEDFSANRSAWVQAGTYPVAGNKDTTFTETPVAPTASVGTMRIQVSHNLNATVGSLPSDLDYFEVYASTSSGFTPSSSNMLGTMKVNILAVQTFDIPASAGSGTTQTWFVKVRGVDRAGNKSAYSAQATASVGLIATANIGDLAVTNAKIGTVDANKITAGQGIITDLTVKSLLTLGDASTVGTIQTFGYVAGVTGAHFSKNLIEINQGSIAAGALKIQNSPNLLPSQYAGFEYTTGFYTTDNQVYNENVTLSMSTADKKYESQSLSVVWSTAGAVVYLASAVDDYNIPVEPGDYIYSLYAKSVEMSGTTSVNVKFVFDNAVTSATFNHTATVGNGWERFTGVVTVPSGVAQMLMYLPFADPAGALLLDGVQVERKIGALTTPSQWKPPGITTVDGGAIRTGFLEGTLIRSNTIRVDHLEGGFITSDWMDSKFIVGKEMTTAESGRRWWVGPSKFDDLGNRTVIGGMKMFDDDGFAYINFPDDGSEARFSGGVTANELTVTGDASLSDTEIVKGRTVTLQKGTTAPTAGPVISADHETFSLGQATPDKFVNGTRFGIPANPVWNNVEGLYVDSTHIMAMEWLTRDQPFEEGSYLWVWDRTTRECLRVVTYYSNSDWRWIGITKVANRYFAIHDTPSTQTVDEIFPLTSPGTTTTRYTTIRAYNTIGNDGTRIILGWKDGSGSTSKFNINHLDLTAWTIDTLQSTSTNSSFDFMKGVAEGNFDYGSNRLVVGSLTNRNFRSFSGPDVPGSTRTYESGENWPVQHASNKGLAGFCHDGTYFWSIGTDGILTKYSNVKWNVGSSKIWVAVKYRNNIVNAETSLGKASSKEIPKRTFLSVNHLGITGEPVATDEPDSIGIYLVRSDTTPAVGDYKWQLNTATGTGSHYFTSIDESGLTPPAAIAFVSGSPSRIVSSDVGPDGPLIELKADGFARLNQLHLTSGTDASPTAPGNKPALRVGPLTGSHLRIDGNEIISMASDTVQGGLGIQGKFLNKWNWGSESVTTGASGNASFPHGLGTTPTAVLVTFYNPGENINNTIVVRDVNATNISVHIKTASSGAIFTGTRVLYWFAIA
jgi:hypothetical protein